MFSPLPNMLVYGLICDFRLWYEMTFGLRPFFYEHNHYIMNKNNKNL